MNEISYISNTFLKEFRENKLGEPYLYLKVLDRPVVCQRKEILEDIYINEAFDCINVVDTNSNQKIIKNKFIPKNNILMLLRVRNRNPKEVISTIDSILIEAFKSIIHIKESDLSINDLGEIYINDKKIVSFDIKEICEDTKKCVYVFLSIFCKNTHSYENIIEEMSVKSKYGYIEDSFLIQDINSFCQYIKSLLINNFLIKDFSKEYTLNYIKNILFNLNIKFEEELHTLVDGIYISKITLPELGMQQLGKGITQEASLCSGYAEIIERLQNLQFFPESMDMFYSIKDFNFKAYPDERLVDSKVFLPFYDFSSNSVEYLDIEGIWDSQKSNGMASGNTYYEAIVQGLCEVFERFVENEIFDRNLTPPDIDISYIKDNYYFQYSIIKKLEESLNVKILIKDCSLYNTFPVLALVIIDNKDKTYKKVFGSHPLFEEALNRCLSELLQKEYLNYKDIKIKNFTNIYLSEYYDKPYFKLMRATGHLGKVSIPNSFFYKEASWKFIPWKENNIYSNRVWCKKLVDIIKKFNWDLNIRSNDFLNFPSIYLYIPEVSTIQVNKYSYYQKQIDLLVHEQKQLKKEDLEGILKFVEGYEDNTYFSNIDRDMLLIYLYFITDNYQKGIQAIRTQLHPTDELRCLSMEMYLKSKGVMEEDRDNIIKSFFGLEYVEYIKRFWRKKEDSISIFREDTFTKINIEEDRFKEIKDIMYKNSKNQATFASIFNKIEEG